jgi:hypothetical protein
MTFLRLQRYYLEHHKAWENFAKNPTAVTYKKRINSQKKVNELTNELKQKHKMTNMEVMTILSMIGTPARRPGTPLR